MLELAAERGIQAKIVQGERSLAEQQALYESGRSVTKAPGGLSYHNYGLAFDIVPDAYVNLPNWNPDGPYWPILGGIGESLGLSWGGRWKNADLPHFELNAVPVRELKAYWDKFKQIMPVSISPTTGGIAIVVLIGVAWVWWLEPELKRHGIL